MTPPLKVGANVLKKPMPESVWRRYPVRVVQTFDDYQKAVAIRSAVFIAEQDCPYEEEFDGNDFAGLHLLAFDGKEPIATLRIRWFADFAKIERVSVLPAWRGAPVVKVIFATALEIISQKGYKRALGHIQKRLWPMWSNVLHCHIRPGRQEFRFSDFEYCEVEIPLPAHPDAVSYHSNPYVLLRPEGDWMREGVLERSAERQKSEAA